MFIIFYGGSHSGEICSTAQKEFPQIFSNPGWVESTALGAAYLAGLSVGYRKSPDDVVQNAGIDRIFRPAIDESARARDE